MAASPCAFSLNRVIRFLWHVHASREESDVEVGEEGCFSLCPFLLFYFHSSSPTLSSCDFFFFVRLLFCQCSFVSCKGGGGWKFLYSTTQLCFLCGITGPVGASQSCHSCCNFGCVRRFHPIAVYILAEGGRLPQAVAAWYMRKWNPW